MRPITPEQVTPQITALFNLNHPTMPRAFNVLEGITRGQIVVDELENPTWAIVREAAYGTLYPGGQLDKATIESLVSHFRQIGEVGIGCWLDDPLNDLLPSQADYDGRTLYFTHRTSHTDFEPAPLPNGYSLRPRDSHLLPRSPDYESNLISFGSAENILRHTLGVYILYDDRIVCEASTGAATHGLIEIGVGTAESHRQRGLAYLACKQLIGQCEAEGLSVWWDCAKQNLPSVKLAHKLGFHSEREYRYVWWAKG